MPFGEKETCVPSLAYCIVLYVSLPQTEKMHTHVGTNTDRWGGATRHPTCIPKEPCAAAVAGAVVSLQPVTARSTLSWWPACKERTHCDRGHRDSWRERQRNMLLSAFPLRQRVPAGAWCTCAVLACGAYL
jgi:hypothetical protein